ncbi:MAG: hypothetical protein K5767_06475 [Clostridia bacterium]|nr:hypothetical protein [Clostridia bacterium]
MSEEKERSDFKFEIKTHIGVLSENTTGWTKELNLVSWNGRKEKYDIRDWSPRHRKMSRGITMTDEEFDQLSKLISSGLKEEAGMDAGLGENNINPEENRREEEDEQTELSA